MDDLEKLVRDQAAIIKTLQVEIAQVKDRLPEAPQAAPVAGSEFPRALYREQKKVKAAQIDHPGHDSKVVKDQAALDAAIADGWSVDVPDEYVYASEDEPKKSAKK